MSARGHVAWSVSVVELGSLKAKPSVPLGVPSTFPVLGMVYSNVGPINRILIWITMCRQSDWFRRLRLLPFCCTVAGSSCHYYYYYYFYSYDDYHYYSCPLPLPLGEL